MSSAEQPEHLAQAPDDDETVVAEASVTVRRSPRYLSFMIVGAVAGAVLAFVLTVAFPSNSEFAPTQVFGFLLLAGVVAGLTVGAVAAIVIDRLTQRTKRTVVVAKLGRPAQQGEQE